MVSSPLFVFVSCPFRFQQALSIPVSVSGSIPRGEWCDLCEPLHAICYMAAVFYACFGALELRALCTQEWLRWSRAQRSSSICVAQSRVCVTQSSGSMCVYVPCSLSPCLCPRFPQFGTIRDFATLKGECTQSLWMFNMAYEHHEQMPLYFGDNTDYGDSSSGLDDFGDATSGA